MKRKEDMRESVTKKERERKRKSSRADIGRKTERLSERMIDEEERSVCRKFAMALLHFSRACRKI